MRGARLVLPARNLKAAEETKTRIATEFPGAEIVVLPLDLSSFASVRCFVSRFLALRLPLNLLVYAFPRYFFIINSYALSRYSLLNRGSVSNRNNAGKFSHDYAVSEDGVEMTFATNYLGRRNSSLQPYIN